MKTKSQIALFQSIRKALPPQNRVERPVKGGGYRRKNKWGNQYGNE
jgi:hypothetical protein